jgi:hypothetical protein
MDKTGGGLRKWPTDLVFLVGEEHRDMAVSKLSWLSRKLEPPACGSAASNARRHRAQGG